MCEEPMNSGDPVLFENTESFFANARDVFELHESIVYHEEYS